MTLALTVAGLFIAAAIVLTIYLRPDDDRAPVATIIELLPPVDTDDDAA